MRIIALLLPFHLLLYDTPVRMWTLSLIGLLVAVMPFGVSAASLTYRYQHHLFTIVVGNEWQEPREVWTFEGRPAKVPATFRVDGDHVPAFPVGFQRSEVTAWNRDAIRAALKRQIASVFDRPAGSVEIQGSGTGAITFEGVGMTGRRMDLERAVILTIAALDRDIADITLPVIETQPSITVRDSLLAAQGIQEVLSIGESDFSGSPRARKHNINVGLEKFNGTLIPQGATFSFNEILGPVTAATGYLRELVIMGDKTLPDYGGGLCQVGTTAYRGVWEYGFPIIARRNHSFAVHYYSPQGTDATIYPPYTDIQFLNDSSGALLIQTFTENDHAYFIYYGTPDGRQTEVIGPYTWGSAAPPPDKIEYTTDIPAGTTRKVGERVPGIKALWWRLITNDDKETEESVYSVYEARPRFDQIGVEPTSSLLLPDQIVPTASSASSLSSR
ncbi:hypothetical protein AUJ46_02375 [Candidatus Peregrinibacteria bacterium CG1_02_54_53]|nr:MAG: hypothetical protein AUJ46_02375 [Candidatus Peregrinibacteria bacterium CG1_02_54_53]